MINNILFVISEMHGGGAERVITILSDCLCRKGKKVTLIITGDTEENSRLEALNENVNVIFLQNMIKQRKYDRVLSSLIMLLTRFISKIGFGEKASVMKYYSRHSAAVMAMRKLFKSFGKAAVISFLNEPIFLTLLSKNKNLKVIISERNDPSEFTKNKTTMSFIHKIYPSSDMMVCQSPDAKKWYDDNSSVKSTVIFNPVKSDLPLPYAGERRKKIVNFCRISTQKNLIMLVDAFDRLSKDYPHYELEIIGNAVGNGADGYKDEVTAYIKSKNLLGKVHIFPGRNDIHEYIKDYAMFVSSSDFEGMSNSMLEAMAMGMPVVCTDCPAGGARAVIKDHENGLLTPVGDAEALYEAMKEIIENPELAKKLGENAEKIREEQSVEKITEKWMEIISA